MKNLTGMQPLTVWQAFPTSGASKIVWALDHMGYLSDYDMHIATQDGRFQTVAPDKEVYHVAKRKGVLVQKAKAR